MGLAFNGTSKVITLSSGTTELGVRDLWSRGVDWWLTGDNSKFLFPFSQTGGDPIDASAGTSIPIYIFLESGWRVKPQEASHTLKVSDGVLVVSGGGDPFVDTAGSFTVRVNYSQPVQAITVSTGGGSGGGASAVDVANQVRVNLTPELGQISAIKTSTDRLPVRPANEATVEDARDYAAAV